MTYIYDMVIVETSIFTKRIATCMSDSEYRDLQAALIQNPEAGDLIMGSGGLRKIRWSGSGRGKRGGSRIIYYWWVPDQVMMLFAYTKNETRDLTPSQIKQLRILVEEWLHEKE